jgi:hypothetical protein
MLVLVVTSSGLASSQSAAAGRENSDRTVKNAAGGVLIAIPRTWKSFPPKGAMGNVQQRLNFVAPGRSFWGITVSSGPHNPNLIGAFSLAETKPLQTLARTVLSPNKSISHLRTAANGDLVAGFAALVSHDVSVGGAPKYSVRAYWLVSGGRIYILAGVTAPGQMPAHVAAFQKIFGTFRPYAA